MTKLKILVVDDDPASLKLIEETLRKESSYELHAFNSANKVVSRMGFDDFDAVISDQQMPEMNGLDLLGCARELVPDAVRIIITGHPDTDAIRRAYDSGIVEHFIAKPWKRDEFLIAVKNALRFAAVSKQQQSLAAEMEKKQQLLAQQVRERYELQRLKQQFIMVANHELRTPATIITSALDILKNRNHNLDSTQQKFINNASSGAQRLNAILERLNHLIRYGSGTRPIEGERVDVAHILEQTRNKLANIAASRNISLEFSAENGLAVNGEPAEILTVLENLVLNAIKFTPDHGSIKVKASFGESAVQISVEDSGIGLPAEAREKVFDAFFQVNDPMNHHSSKHEFLGGGAGIGLTICRSIVLAHGGSIRVESPGTDLGSTFYITLPVYTSARPADTTLATLCA